MILSLKKRLKTLERGNATENSYDKTLFYIPDNGKGDSVTPSPHVVIYNPDITQGDKS